LFRLTSTEIRTLLHKVNTLRDINIRDIIQPEIYFHYEQTLQAAYDALTQVEDALTTLGMKLEYQHWRLGGAVEELQPLMIQTRSGADLIIEELKQQSS